MHWALRQSTWWCAQGAVLLPWRADWPAGAGMPCIPSLQQPFPVRRRWFKDLLAPLYLFFKGLGAVAAHANDVRRERGFWCLP